MTSTPSPSAPPRGFSSETTAEGMLVARYRHPDAALALVGLPFAVAVLGWMGWTVGQAMVDVMGKSPAQAFATVGALGGLLAIAIGYGLLGVAFNTTEMTVQGTGEAATVEVTVRPFPRRPARRVACIAVERVVVRTREEVYASGGGIRGGGTAKIRSTTHHDLGVETAAGRRVALLSDTNAAAVDAFARLLAEALDRPVAHEV